MSTPWRVIKDRLVADGDMTEQHVTRTPKARHCRHCGRSVIAAITDCGFEVAVEPTPTTVAGELHVLLAGGSTYALIPGVGMVRRDHHRIEHHTPDTEPTHAKHECSKPPPEVHPRHVAMKARAHPHPDDPIPY